MELPCHLGFQTQLNNYYIYVVCNLRHYVIPGITYVICGTQFTYVICGRSPQKPDLHILFVTDDPQI